MKWLTFFPLFTFLWYPASSALQVANDFIVEFVDNPSAKQGSEDYTVQQFSQQIKQLGMGIQVKTQFDSESIFRGAKITVTNPGDIAVLHTKPFIKTIWPVNVMTAPRLAYPRSVDADSPNFVDTQSSHIITGIEKVHAEGNTGKGIKIGLIDTGIDYMHEYLGKGFGPGFKVAGGYDFVGDDWDGINEPVEDEDPMDCYGHGTHVAGVIGANPGNPFNISGAAPDAELYAYRIFGCNSEIVDDVIIKALHRAHQDGMQVINLSLGKAGGWSESALTVVASRIAEAGVVITVSAGEDGTQGAWFASYPSTGKGIISVASTDDASFKGRNIIVNNGQFPPIPYLNLMPLKIADGLALYFTSNTTKILNDACAPLTESTPDLSNYLVIIRRGGCVFTDKLKNVAERGAKYALVYDNGSGMIPTNMGDQIPASLIRAEDGAWLLEQYLAGNYVTLSFPQDGEIVEFPNPNGGLASASSSYGPTYEGYIVPGVSAPGGNVLSTYPRAKGSYAILNGPAISAPLVAGSAALILAAKGPTRENGLKVKQLLEASATLIGSHNKNTPFETLCKTGGGLINVYNAIHSNTALSTTQLLLNDTAHFVGTHEFTITNEDKTERAYQLQHIPAGTAVTMTQAGTPVSDPLVPLTNVSILLSLSAEAFTLQPGQSHTITARFTIPENVSAQLLPVFSGAIAVKSADESVQVVYLGIGGNLIDQKVLTTDTLPFEHKTPLLMDQSGKIQDENTTYSWVGDDHPAIVMRLSFGSPRVVVDLVDVDTKIPGAVVPRSVKNETHFATRQQTQTPSTGSFGAVQTIGHIQTLEYLGRNANPNPVDSGYHTGHLAAAFSNGTHIPNGCYRYLLRALGVFGNPDDQNDYESWLSPVVGFRR